VLSLGTEYNSTYPSYLPAPLHHQQPNKLRTSRSDMAVFSRTWFLIAVVPLLIAVFYSRETKIADSPSERSQRSPIRKSYSCGPCVLPDCHCPSTAIPGGLALNDTPQFILLTFDDAVSTTTFPLELAVCETLYYRLHGKSRLLVTV